MAIEFVGRSESANNSNTLVLPPHQAGDFIIAFATRISGSFQITNDEAWTEIARNGSVGVTTTYNFVIATRRVTSSSTPNPVFPGAMRVSSIVYRGCYDIGARSYIEFYSSSARRRFAAITVQVSDGSSLLLRGATSQTGVNTLYDVPAHYTQRDPGLNARLWEMNTTPGVSIYPSEVYSISSSTSTMLSYSFELLSIENAPELTGTIKAYNGTGFVSGKVKGWNGSEWVDPKTWNGTEWI